MAITRWIESLHEAGAKAMATLRGMGLLLAVVLSLVACEYPGVPHPLAAQTNQSVSITPTPTPSLGDGSNPDSGGGSELDPLQDMVNISLKDFRLDPDQVKVKSGAITFVLKNEGRYTHDFRVEGEGIDEKAPKVGQGRTFNWQITLPTGKYRISCPISNHADRGMVGTLEVVP